MAPISLTDNINRIECGICEFNGKIDELKMTYDKDLNKLREEVCRLEGCKLVYETLQEVYGEFIPSKNDDSHEEVGHEHDPDHSHGHGHDTGHDTGHDPEHKLNELIDEPMSLSDLYQKYRAM